MYSKSYKYVVVQESVVERKLPLSYVSKLYPSQPWSRHDNNDRTDDGNCAISQGMLSPNCASDSSI